LQLPEEISEQEKLADEVEQRLLAIWKMRNAAECQLEAIDALNGATLRNYFQFGAVTNA
jgi:hypothetical protein